MIAKVSSHFHMFASLLASPDKADLKMLCFTKAWSLSWLLLLNTQIFDKQKTRLRSPSLASRVTASSPARFYFKVGRYRNPENSLNLTERLVNLRFAVVPDFAVKLSKEACGHSRS